MPAEVRSDHAAFHHNGLAGPQPALPVLQIDQGQHPIVAGFGGGAVTGEMVPWTGVRTLAADLQGDVRLDVLEGHNYTRLPVIEHDGRVIGVVALSMAEVGRFTLGIPANLADRLLAGIEADGSYENPSPSGWIGLLSYPVGEELIVASAMPGSPAERAGIAEGDRIESIDGQSTRSRRSLYTGLRSSPPGSKLRLGIRRGSESISIEVVTGAIERYFAT